MDWFWKTGCKTVTENDRLNLNLRIIGIPDDLYEFCLWSRHGRAVSGDFRGDHFSLFGLGPAWLQRNGGGDSRIHRNQIASAIQFLIGPDEPFLCTLQNLHDVSFHSAPLLSVGPDHDPVSVHHAAHFAAIEVKILRTLIVENEKTEAIRVGVDPSRYQVLCVRQPIVIFLQPYDTAFPRESPQGVDDPLEFVAPKASTFLYFDGCQSSFRLLGEEIENSLPCGFCARALARESLLMAGLAVNLLGFARDMLESRGIGRTIKPAILPHPAVRYSTTPLLQYSTHYEDATASSVINQSSLHIAGAGNFPERHVVLDRF